jgi:diadenosine tetraphosphate (Ap4A) HIT family hydrolase
VLVEGCIACAELRGAVQPPGGVIYEDAHWQIDHGLEPIALAGWLIIKPKRHCEHIAALTSEETASFGLLLRNTARALTEVVHPATVHVHSMGESVKHIHFYIIPRMADMPADGLEVLQQMFEGRWACSEAAAAEVADRVRRILQHLMAGAYHNPVG